MVEIKLRSLRPLPSPTEIAKSIAKRPQKEPLPTREVDLTKMIPYRKDHRTVVYLTPEQFNRMLNRNSK